MRLIGALAAVAALALLGCSRQPPIVQQQVRSVHSGVLAKVAIAPFYPSDRFSETHSGKLSAASTAELVARFFSEALAERGVSVIPANDLLIAFEGAGIVVPRRDPLALARLAAQKFGATSVLLGQVSRYREREGEALGAFRPAHVAFQVSLYEAPSGELLWSARFDEVQPSITANVVRARQYPGGGTRWLSASELARWGAAEVVEAIPQGLR